MYFIKKINKKNKKIISFSLWGNSLKYLVGAKKNILLAKKIYPEWICRIHIDDDFLNQNQELINFITSKNNTEVVVFPNASDSIGYFWRFYPCSDIDVDIMISRDCDSRLSIREKKSVEKWLKSKYLFHIMRDHPNHNFIILAGMWGARCSKTLRNMSELIENFKIENRFTIDQEFLEKQVYPLVKETTYLSDPFIEKIPFPGIRWGYNFVGNVYDEFDSPNIEYIKQLNLYIKERRFELYRSWVLNILKSYLKK